jgi:hypothetical protein
MEWLVALSGGLCTAGFASNNRNDDHMSELSPALQSKLPSRHADRRTLDRSLLSAQDKALIASFGRLVDFLHEIGQPTRISR